MQNLSILSLAMTLTLTSVECRSEPLTCNPNIGRVNSRISCLTQLVDALNEGVASLRSELSRYATSAELSDYVRTSDLNRQLSSLQSELSRYATSAELSGYVRASDLNKQLSSLKSELSKYSRSAVSSGASARPLAPEEKVASREKIGSLALCGVYQNVSNSGTVLRERRSVATLRDELGLNYSTTTPGLLAFDTQLEIAPASQTADGEAIGGCMPGELAWLRREPSDAE
jgi:hypothetical protein